MNSFLWWGDKESHCRRERSRSRTSSETRLWWKSVEEKISGREQSVVWRVARFSEIKNVWGSCTVAIRRHWEPGGEQMLWWRESLLLLLQPTGGRPASSPASAHFSSAFSWPHGFFYSLTPVPSLQITPWQSSLSLPSPFHTFAFHLTTTDRQSRCDPAHSLVLPCFCFPVLTFLLASVSRFSSPTRDPLTFQLASQRPSWNPAVLSPFLVSSSFRCSCFS